MPKLSIIIPAYNEEKRIGDKLNTYSSYFEALRKKNELDYEIIVVINNTRDKTEEIVKSFRKNPRIKYLNFKRGGKGFAVIEGFREAVKGDSDFIGFVDADLSTSPEAFHSLLKSIDDYDGGIASRYVKGAKVFPKPKLRRIIVSRIFNALIRVLFFMPFRDTQCGAKIFRKNPLSKVIPDITFSQWAFDVDLLYSFKKRGYRVKEVSTTWSDTNYSRINFMRAGPWMALGVIRIRLLNSPLRWLIRLYDKVLTRIWRSG